MQLDDLGAALVQSTDEDLHHVSGSSEDVFYNVRQRPNDPRYPLLMALEEAIGEQTSTNQNNPGVIFAGIMAALEACVQGHKWRQTSELLGLLGMALPAVSHSILRNKFDVGSVILIQVIEAQNNKKRRRQEDDIASESTTACARQAARCLGSMLAVQDESAWSAPAKRRSLRILLKTAVWESRPKVRKAARAACAEAIARKIAPSRLVADGVIEHVRQASTSSTPAAFHALALVETLADCIVPECALRMLDTVAEITWPMSGNGLEASALSAIASLAQHAFSRKARAAVVRLGSHCLGTSDEAIVLKWCRALQATLNGVNWQFPDDENEAQAIRAALALCVNTSTAITNAVLEITGLCVVQTRSHAPTLYGGFRAIILGLIERSWAKKQPLMTTGMENWFGNGRDLAEVIALLAPYKDNVSHHKPDEFFIRACRLMGPALFCAAVGMPFTSGTSIPIQARIKWLAPCVQHALQSDCECQLATFLDQWLLTASALASSPTARRECWRPAASFLTVATDLELSLPRFTDALTALLQEDNPDLTVVIECCTAAGSRHTEPAVAAMARSLSPILLAVVLRPQTEDAVHALHALAPALEPQVSSTLFKKLAKRLVASLSFVLGIAAQKKKRGRDEDHDQQMQKEEVSTKDKEQLACALLRAAAALIPGLSELAQLEVLWRAARPVLEAATVPVGVQKQAYVLVQALIADDTWLMANCQQLAECLVSGSLLACHIPVRAVRLRTIELLITSQHFSDQQTLAALLGEAVLGVKDANAKARKAAFALLDAMAQVVNSITALLDMLVAALGARTPHMRSAAISALTKVVYDRRNELVLLDALPKLITAASLLLRDRAREVAKATLAFIAVAVSALCTSGRTQALDQLLVSLVPALLLWAKEKKGRFRLKVKMILLKLCRNLGFDTILHLVPSDDSALISHLRKKHSKSNSNKKKKQQQNQHAVNQKFDQEEDALDDDHYFDDFKEEDGAIDEDDDEIMEFVDNDDDDDENDIRHDFHAKSSQQEHILAAALNDNDNDELDDDNETDVQFDSETGRIIVTKKVHSPSSAVENTANKNFHPGKSQKPREPKARKLRGKEAAAAKRKHKSAKSDALRPGQLQPYSWSTLGELVRSSKRRRKS